MSRSEGAGFVSQCLLMPRSWDLLRTDERPLLTDESETPNGSKVRGGGQ
jgi:hypothetical protein